MPSRTVDYVDSYLELSEQRGGQNGLGSYLLRSSLHAWVLLEAPHSDDDLYTGRIVRNLFLTGYFAGAGFNSLSRWSVDRQARYGDFARREDTAFAAFAVAFLAEHPGGTVVQIHGFDAEKRGEASFADADIVVSDGTTRPARGPMPSAIAWIACCLAAFCYIPRILGNSAAPATRRDRSSGKAAVISCIWS